METTAHIDFIAAAYAAAVIVVSILVAWVTLDYRAQRRTLANLELQGFVRRPGPLRSNGANEAATDTRKAREQA
jgi:heme exporter protein D